MLKIKSKAILAFAGLMVALFVFGGALSASADMVTLPAAGVHKTDSISTVQALQTFLNWNLGASITPLAVDGVYGAKTTAAIKLFQSNNGLVADGIFGRLSAAKAMALQANAGGVVYAPGCTSNSGYSSTTGMPCSGGTSWPAGCTSNAGYSSTSGLPCSTPVGTTLPAGCASTAGYSTTTGAPCSSTTVNSGTNGYLADLASDTTNRVSTVYESESDKVVAGFRATARLADQTVSRVRVTFLNTNTTASANLGKYISGASLWYGSTKIATMAVAQADRATSSDTYTFNFSGLNAKIAKDQIGRFYVSVNANGSLDSTDTTNANWTVRFVAGGVSASSPDGSYDTYPTNDIVQTGLLFGKFSSSGVKATVGLDATNPQASVVTVQNTTATNNVDLLKFSIKATNSNLTLRKVPVQVRIVPPTTAANDMTDVINSIRLMRDGQTVDSLSGTDGYEATYGSASNTTNACVASANAADDVCTFFFSNLSAPSNMIASGTTATFTVQVDLKPQSNYDAGTTIEAEINNADILLSANFSVQDTNGDQLPNSNSSIRVGSGVGNAMTLLVNGVNVVMGAATVSTTSDSGVITKVTYSIPLSVTATGNTLYTGQAAVLGTSVSGTGASAKAFAFTLQEAAAPANDITSAPTGITVTSTLASDATIENLGYRLDSGTTKHYTLQVILTCSAGACSTATTANYRVRVAAVGTDTVNSLPTNTNQALLPVQNFQTTYQTIK